jgi:ribosomal-protein-alanine N-acetyltransferase
MSHRQEIQSTVKPEMRFAFRPITEADARKMIGWRYEPPYSIYDLSEDELSELLHPDNRYYSVLDNHEILIGLCCFGKEARVEGGDYPQLEPMVLDLGLGLRPDLTGKGLGSFFLQSLLDFAIESFSPQRLRATVAKFNRRSQRIFQHLGFTITHSFIRPDDGIAFVQLERHTSWKCEVDQNLMSS